MSQLYKAMYKKRTISHRLSLALISSVFGAVLLAMFAGAASAQSDSTIGRGFTGVVRSVGSDGLLTVESKGSFFQLSVTGGTVINNPPDKDVGWEGLPADIGFRIAGLVDIAITDAAGNVTSLCGRGRDRIGRGRGSSRRGRRNEGKRRTWRVHDRRSRP